MKEWPGNCPKVSQVGGGWIKNSKKLYVGHRKKVKIINGQEVGLTFIVLGHAYFNHGNVRVTSKTVQI